MTEPYDPNISPKGRKIQKNFSKEMEPNPVSIKLQQETDGKEAHFQCWKHAIKSRYLKRKWKQNDHGKFRGQSLTCQFVT